MYPSELRELHDLRELRELRDTTDAVIDAHLGLGSRLNRERAEVSLSSLQINL